MTFEENGIRKQEAAYKESYATYQFNRSCEFCCTRNLRSGRGSCTTCPIKGAYEQALKEIRSGKRSAPDFSYGRKVYTSTYGRVEVEYN